MNAEDRHLPSQLNALFPSQQRDAGTEAKPSHPAAQDCLPELEKLIRGVLAAPAEEMDGEAVALVRRAMKARPKFSVALALRALRLEQGLREAQRRVIQLQWELAQFRRCVTAFPPGAGEVED
ncbi:MAG TPA: hypothetical protein VMH26_14775 [Burkholderiales bacterium]|nr:hypothetical protein [Burkholderiales bacterium]